MKKGFTLIELIGVIVILGVVAAFSVPALTKTLKKSADKEYEEFLKNISIAAENYFHNETDGVINGRRFISIGTLVSSGYLKKTINPINQIEVSDDATVIIYKDSDGIERYLFSDSDVTTDGYVKNGLILLYDGYSGPINNKWPDLSGNNNDGNIVGATWKTIYYDLDGVNDYISRPVTINGNYGTIEICSEYLAGDVILSFDNGRINNLNVTKGTSSLFKNVADFGTRGLTYASGTYTAYFDGVLSSNQSYTNSSNGSFISIGSSSVNTSNNVSRQKVYSVRVYNRALTKDEIVQNNIVDKYRFGNGK